MNEASQSKSSPSLIFYFRILTILLGLGELMSASPANAHEFRPATLGLKEVRPGLFEVRTTKAVTRADEQVSISARYPSPCRLHESLLNCGEGGLDGTIAFEGLSRSSLRVVLHIQFENGAHFVRTLTAQQPEVLVQGGRHTSAKLRVLKDYSILGVEHILSGYDHLLFVTLLIILAGFHQRLVWAVTAFTIAHSITLALAVLNWGHVSPPFVEFMIALSLVLLARQVVQSKQTSLTQRALWIPAFCYGLLHGLGFSSALHELGLPPYQVSTALLSFNVGVELGQLSVIVALWVFSSLLQSTKWRDPPHWKWAASTAAGVAGMYWTIDRGWTLFFP